MCLIVPQRAWWFKVSGVPVHPVCWAAATPAAIGRCRVARRLPPSGKGDRFLAAFPIRPNFNLLQPLHSLASHGASHGSSHGASHGTSSDLIFPRFLACLYFDPGVISG
jgi:hypothetical protein